MSITDLFGEMRVDELSKEIEELFPSLQIPAERMLTMLFQGRLLELAKALFYSGIGGCLERVAGVRGLLISLLLIGMISAMTGQFAEVLERFQVSELSFYFTYLLLSAILTRCFLALSEVAKLALGSVCLFVRLLMPTYLFAVGMSTGSITAGCSHQMVLLIIYVVEKVLLGILLPLIKCFFLITLLEGLQSRERMDVLLGVIKKGIRWSIRGALGIIAGLSFLQAVLTPSLDKLSGSVVTKMIAAVPGIGRGAEGTIELVMSAAMVIKNGMGIILSLLLLLLCSAPIFELFVYSSCLKIAAALTGIVSDKRISKTCERAGETGFLLMTVVAGGMILFLFTMAVTCAAAK